MHKQQAMTSSDMKLGEDKTQSSRDYDWLKSQCDWAMSELQSLRTDHQDTVKKCEQAVKEADLHRHNYKVSVRTHPRKPGKYWHFFI